MKKITESEWAKIPKDYKSIWSSDDMRGTNFNGRKTIMVSGEGGSTLLIEGESFEIIDDLNCEMCDALMTEEQHNTCDICGDCLEGEDECEDDENINDLMN